MKWTILCIAAAGVLAACASMPMGDSDRPLHRSVAAEYGINAFDRVGAIRYTFNAKLGDRGVSRSWIWHPGEDKVTKIPGDGGASRTYLRARLHDAQGDELKAIDAQFINDRYWLVFPFQMVWDTGARIEDRGEGVAPISGKSFRHLVVKYPPMGGYTPGDIYEIFIDARYRMAEWIYRKGGSPNPTRVSTWEDHRRVGPLMIAMDHKGADDQFRVWFTDVGVKLKGNDRWLSAE